MGVDPKFIPLTSIVKQAYISYIFNGSYAAFVERYEYELGFDEWLEGQKDN